MFLLKKINDTSYIENTWQKDLYMQFINYGFLAQEFKFKNF